MGTNSGTLIPARFLALAAHLTIIVAILWSRRENVLACLPLGYIQTQYDSKDTNFTAGLAVALGLTVLESISFLFGISIFRVTVCVLSIVLHAAASIGLSIFLLDSWSCDYFWYFFGFCSALPIVIEFFVFIGVVCLKTNGWS